MVTRESVAARRDEILEIARRHGAHDVRLFGSVARGDATESSDVDLLVKFEPARTLMDHAGLICDLEDLLGVKVDVVNAAGMHARFRAVVEREALPL